jgi:hypothetical protein
MRESRVPYATAAISDFPHPNSFLVYRDVELLLFLEGGLYTQTRSVLLHTVGTQIISPSFFVLFFNFLKIKIEIHRIVLYAPIKNGRILHKSRNKDITAMCIHHPAVYILTVISAKLLKGQRPLIAVTLEYKFK